MRSTYHWHSGCPHAHTHTHSVLEIDRVLIGPRFQSGSPIALIFILLFIIICEANNNIPTATESIIVVKQLMRQERKSHSTQAQDKLGVNTVELVLIKYEVKCSKEPNAIYRFRQADAENNT